MKINSRRKGSTGETELIHSLEAFIPELLGKLARNLEQTRWGGYDITGLDGWAPEVKRCAKFLPSGMVRHWKQAVDQSRKERLRPVLFYRADRSEWRVVMRLIDVVGTERLPAMDFFNDELNNFDFTLDMSLKSASHLIRKSLDV